MVSPARRFATRLSARGGRDVSVRVMDAGTLHYRPSRNPLLQAELTAYSMPTGPPSR